MKQLVVSLKTSSEALNDFASAYKRAKSFGNAQEKERKTASSHYEISFDNKKDFERFVKNIHILSDILAFKPKSIYELAKISRIDVSNLNKIMLFFEAIDAVRFKTSEVDGRTIKTPIVDYDGIEF